MSLVADLIAWFGPNLALFLVFVYELFWPKWLHPTGGTRLQKLLQEPHPAVKATLIALAEQNNQTDDDVVKKWFNADRPRASDLKIDPSDMQKGS